MYDMHLDFYVWQKQYNHQRPSIIQISCAIVVNSSPSNVLSKHRRRRWPFLPGKSASQTPINGKDASTSSSMRPATAAIRWISELLDMLGMCQNLGKSHKGLVILRFDSTRLTSLNCIMYYHTLYNPNFAVQNSPNLANLVIFTNSRVCKPNSLTR